MFSNEGKEGTQRWCLQSGRIVCMELVRVSSTTLLWAEVRDSDQMSAIEENKDFLVIPIDPITPPPSSNILLKTIQSPQVDFDKDLKKSFQEDPSFSETE